MKYLALSILAAVGMVALPSASAQPIVNASFETGDFTGWETTMPLAINPGSPAVVTGGLQPINGTPSVVFDPVKGNYQAYIQSTGGSSPDQGVDIATLRTFLGISPATVLPGNQPLYDGTAIKQTFTVGYLGGAKMAFAYGYQSRESVASGLDETGVVVNGIFTKLVDSDSPGVIEYDPVNGIFESYQAYQTGTQVLSPGVNTVGFVSYNTVTTLSTTGLLIDNIVLIPMFSTVAGLTPNQESVATYIDNNDLSTDPSLNNAITALGNVTTAQQLGDDLDQLSPQSLQVFRSIAFDNATYNTLNVTNHLANLRDGLTGFDPSQLKTSDPSALPGTSQIKNHLRDPKDLRDPKEMTDSKEMVSPAAAATADRWSTFIAGDVVLADLTHDEDMAHQDYTTGSVMLGADYRIDDHFTVGAFFDYSHTDATLDHIGSQATVDTYSPGIYGSYVDGGWYGDALLTYGFNSYTEDRNIFLPGLSGTNHGAPQGNQYTGSLLGGYEFHTGDFKYGPFAGVQYVNLDIDSFTENGPTALAVQNQSDDSLRSQLGFEARYATHISSVSLIPHVSVAWQHEFLDNNKDITSSFAGVGGAFTVETTSVDRDSAVIDAGLDAGVCDDVTLFTDYATEAGESSYFSQSISAGVRVGF